MTRVRETRSSFHKVYFKVFECALRRFGCDVCNHLDAMERKVINGTFYDSIMNGNRGRKLAMPGATCAGHLRAPAEIERPEVASPMAQFCKEPFCEAQRSAQRQYSAQNNSRFTNA